MRLIAATNDHPAIVLPRTRPLQTRLLELSRLGRTGTQSGPTRAFVASAGENFDRRGGPGTGRSDDGDARN